MNVHTTGIIIQREYLNRVKKKSFLLTTFLVPVLFAALCILPTVIMMGAKEEAKRVAVVDLSGIVAPTLETNESVEFVDFNGHPADSVKAHLKDFGLDAVLCISELNIAEKNISADIYSLKPLGMDLTENLGNRINSALENYRIDSYGIEGLKDIMKDVKANVKMHSYTLDDSGKESISESGVYMMVSMILGMIIYMFIALFGGMVMSGVIEEKSSRVVEVLVSSVKATELMFGKIIGIALVAVTQFLLWIALTLAIVGIAGGIMGKNLLSSGSDPTELISSMAGGEKAAEALSSMGVSGMDLSDGLHPEDVAQTADQEGGLSVILGTLGNLPIAEILVCFLVFFILGYMLYASMYAAIGSAVENEGDSQQLQMPVTIPLLIGFFIAIYAFKAPDSALVLWGSMIPFTSPIVMLARLPYGVPLWEIALSVGLLVITFIVCAWASAKIYKVGILMFGKKSSWKDLWKWLKQK